MSLVVFLAPGDREHAAFWYDRASGDSGMGTSLADLAERPAADPRQGLTVAISGERAISRAMRLPMKRARDLRRAADLALDDALAAPIPERLVALGAEVSGMRLVTAVPRAAVEEALATLAEAGLDPERLTVDHALLALPGEAGAVRLSLGPRDIVATPKGAFTAETAFTDDILGLVGDAGVVTIGFEGLMAPDRVPNFRTGSFRRRRPLPDPRPFAMAASLVIAAGVLFLVATLTEGLRYAAAADNLRSEAEDAFARAYPGIPVLDLERQLRGRANAGEDVASDFLPLTAVLAEVLAGQEGTGITSLSYEADGELAAELVFQSFSDLERLTAALAARGVRAEEGSDARREDGAFVTRIFLRVS